MSNYIKIAKNFINNTKINGNYRHFIPLIKTQPPYSLYKNMKIINWCSNDYNNLSNNLITSRKTIDFIINQGIGSGGTRNISGTSPIHTELENTIATLHNKEAGLIFNSGFLANFSSIESLGNLYPNAHFFSDKDNHASIILGIKNTRCNKYIFNHNDLNHLEYLLKKSNSSEKIIVFESLYSMDGSVSPINEISFLAKKYNALTYIDEIHAVGVYGIKGSGITNVYNNEDNIDLIMGGFGKGFGTLGGYITGNKYLIDSIRIIGSGFIFTTSMPPLITHATIENINIISSNYNLFYQKRLSNILYMRELLYKNNISIISNNFEQSHIISILIGDSHKCYNISNRLLNEYGHYVQPINYPTVPYGTERFRICINLCHTKDMINLFVSDLKTILQDFK